MSYPKDTSVINGAAVARISEAISKIFKSYSGSLTDPLQIFNERTTVQLDGDTYVIRVMTQDLTAWGGAGRDNTITNLKALARYSGDYVNKFATTLSMPSDAGLVMYSGSKCAVAAIHYTVQKYKGKVNSPPQIGDNDTLSNPGDVPSGDFTNIIPVPDPEILKNPPVPSREVQGVVETRQNAVQPLAVCKRSDFGEMCKCMGSDTIVSGQKLLKNKYLWAEKGIRLQAESDGNLCAYIYDPTPRNYWCMNWRKPTTKNFWWILEDNGALCRMDEDGTGRCGGDGKSPRDKRYRATLQNDGNLVVYRGVYEKVLWASESDVFPDKGPTPCKTPVP
ncbi:hypothetical protein BGW38_000066 [Lunasporangiospora selenospora]|uniref:Bulb-type lectin domain-containing protein n=1 Tax=Lunasporangiospora selenospora TaxID=979761 RepID=A0A9P6KF88_9FUNG|nr:hypothetical protein BGW38_000066 [Lunasporangiospora selenospora]